jgi:cold shock CspA family protein
VITKGGKDETFVVNSSTQKPATLDAGAHVSVHYTMDGKNMVATAITAQPAKATKTPKGKK